MPSGNYPEHDLNQVFDYMSGVLLHGDTAENALDEMTFVNRLFAALPVGAQSITSMPSALARSAFCSTSSRPHHPSLGFTHTRSRTARIW